MQGLLSGSAQCSVGAISTARAHISAGTAVALAVTGASRWHDLPDVPTMVQAGLVGFEVVGFNGLIAPAGTPRAIVEKLNQEVERILKQPEVKEWFASKALETLGGSPEAFEKDIQSDITKWLKILTDAGVQSH
jgi:tripartite-type tricarboxylate transporter receptor subunit TctC